MKMIIAALTGELKPSRRTELICRICVIIVVVSFIALMVVITIIE